MPIATLTSKGQITLPLAVRTALGLAAGNQVDFVRQGASFVLMPVTSDAAALRGRFAGRVTKPVSIAAMDLAIAEGAVRRSKKPA